MERVDEEVGASWSWDGGKGVLVSYDNAEVAGLKVEYVKRKGLGGAMWWESSADKSGAESLIRTAGLREGCDGVWLC